MKKYILIVVVILSVVLIANLGKDELDRVPEEFLGNSNANVLDSKNGEPTPLVKDYRTPTLAPGSQDSDSQPELDAIDKAANDGMDFSKSHTSEGDQVKEESIMTDDGERVVLKTKVLEAMSHDQVNNFIESLRFSGEKNHLSFEIEVNIDSVVTNMLSGKRGVTSVPAGCATLLCGVLISSESLDDVRSIMDELSSKGNLSQYVNGGFLRIYNENGVYYGLVVAALEKGKPLTLN